MRHFSGNSLCLINSTNLPPPTVCLRVLALTGPGSPRVSRRWDCWVRPWLLHQAWPGGSGLRRVFLPNRMSREESAAAGWSRQYCVRPCCTGWQSLAPHLAVGDLQQPQSPALLQEGSRLAGEADVPTAPCMTRVCAAATAPAPIWAPAVLAQLRPESGTQETWVTSGTGRSRDSHMASQVLTVPMFTGQPHQLPPPQLRTDPQAFTTPHLQCHPLHPPGAAHLPSLGVRTPLSPDKDTH